MTTETKQETAVEDIKRSSNYLRGEIGRELDNDVASVSNESEQILKFHGIYAQDNRDVRRERAVNGEELDYIFMIRIAIPGGRLSTDQWLALDGAATDVADGTIRLTTRQAVQFHGVLKDGLRPLARAVDAHLMTSFGACGDVVRNVVSCPELQGNDADERLREISRHLTRSFRATTEAHWEIFVNGDKAVSREEVTERPFYGEPISRASSRLPSPTPMRTAWTFSPRTSGSSPACTPKSAKVSISSWGAVSVGPTPTPTRSPGWPIP